MYPSRERREVAHWELCQRAIDLVSNHRKAVDAVAKELWNRPFMERHRWEPDKSWSNADKEKQLSGHRIQEILVPCRIQASLLDISIWEEELRAKIRHEMKEGRKLLWEQRHPDRSGLRTKIDALEGRLRKARGARLVEVGDERTALRNSLNR